MYLPATAMKGSSSLKKCGKIQYSYNGSSNVRDDRNQRNGRDLVNKQERQNNFNKFRCVSERASDFNVYGCVSQQAVQHPRIFKYY
ncbi:MAG: hypothetical protein ACTSRI_12240 [Promethearchaeota archaeon]